MEMPLSPGNPAALSRFIQNVGQWLCVPPFRYGLPFSGYDIPPHPEAEFFIFTSIILRTSFITILVISRIIQEKQQ